MSEIGKVLRRLFFAVIVFVLLISAWSGAEYLIQGHTEKSPIDFAVAILIALSISNKLEQGAEISERRNEFAEQFANKLFESIKEKGETKDGEDGNREEC